MILKENTFYIFNKDWVFLNAKNHSNISFKKNDIVLVIGVFENYYCFTVRFTYDFSEIKIILYKDRFIPWEIFSEIT